MEDAMKRKKKRHKKKEKSPLYMLFRLTVTTAYIAVISELVHYALFAIMNKLK